MTQTSKRFSLIDQIRGFAVLLMIIFHLAYDLALFKFVKLTFKKQIDPGWWFLPRIIVFLFLISVGMSLFLVHSPKIQWRKFWKRWSILVLCAVIISISTYFVFPSRWIYFGTLHSIAVCSLMALPLLRFKYINLAISLSLLFPAMVFDKTIPWFMLSHWSMDYIPPFPWVGVACLGIFLARIEFHHKELPKNFFFKSLEVMGKHSLKIYLAHQPILFAITWCLDKILH